MTDAAPLFPWIGGKRRLVKDILPLFPPHGCYVELFAGAAAVFWAKEPSRTEVLNDVDGELANLYRVVKHHLEEFVRQFRWAVSSRQVFDWEKATPPETLTDVQRAARFFYLQRHCFGGRVVSRTFGTTTTAPPRFNLTRVEEDLSAAHLRLAHAVIEHLDWADCLRRYDREHTLFFADPPYWGTEGYGVAFGLDQYVAIADAMRSLKGRMILTINDCPAMREAFAGLPWHRVPIKYTVGGMGRSAQAHELIVRSWGDEGEAVEKRGRKGR